MRLKALVHDALRLGLDALGRRRAPTRVFRTAGFDLGPSRVGSLDNVEEVLSRAEGEAHGSGLSSLIHQATITTEAQSH